MAFPKSKDEWLNLIRWTGWGLVRLQIIGMVIGAIVTVSVQLLTGFWDFREQHHAQIRQYYQAAVAGHEEFESHLTRLNRVFEGNPEDAANVDYATAAQVYIRRLQDVTRLLPETKDQVESYIDAISLLHQYYADTNPPPMGGEEWMLFYGKFRVDYDRYLLARDEYFDALASEVGSYRRYLTNT